MPRKRTLSAALALLLGVTLQTAHATSLGTAQLRAKGCCVGTCQRVGSLGRAMRCCRVPQDAGQTVTLSLAKSSPDPATVWVTAASVPFPAARTEITLLTATAAPCRAGPIFLQTRSLRL